MVKFCIFKDALSENSAPIAINPKKVQAIWPDEERKDQTRIRMGHGTIFTVGGSFEAVIDRLRWGSSEVHSSPHTPKKR